MKNNEYLFTTFRMYIVYDAGRSMTGFDTGSFIIENYAQQNSFRIFSTIFISNCEELTRYFIRLQRGRLFQILCREFEKR